MEFSRNYIETMQAKNHADRNLIHPYSYTTFECKSGEIWTVFNYGEIKSVQKSVQKIVSLIKANPHITTQAIAKSEEW